MTAPAATSTRAEQAARRVRGDLERELQAIGAAWGAPLFLRLYKQERELEAWVRTDAGTYAQLATWPICTWSGTLGPKLREGDGQAPEGVYTVAARQLNPHSRYHLSFDLGYPNAHDRHHGRTGAHLMVHGNCVSIGCYAMGDAAIEEIYTLLAAALDHGQARVQVHALPFRFTDGWQRTHAASPWLAFWSDLAAIDAQFDAAKLPPRVRVVDGRYHLADGMRTP